MTVATKERTLATVQVEYSEKWGGVLQAIRNERQNGEPWLDSLVRRGLDAQLQAGRVVTDLVTLYKAYRDFALRIGRAAHAYKPDAIVEFGAGWGVNLANVWGDARAFEHPHLRDIAYWGFEPVSAGRQCMEEFADYSVGFDIRPRYYDFNKSGHWLDAAEMFPYQRVLVVTCHSIEQIPQIKEEVFTSLLDRFGHVKAMHFEPVGWQPPWGKQTPDYVAENDYNYNLMHTLIRLWSRNRITRPQMTPDVSVVNPDNPTALVEWEKA